MTLNAVPKTNSQPPLPEDRKAAVEYGLTQFNMVAAERDELRNQVRQLKSDLAGYKVAMDAQAAQLAEMESRVATSTAVRDQAVADAAKYQTVLILMQAQMHAVEIPSAPLIVPQQDTEQDTHGGA